MNIENQSNNYCNNLLGLYFTYKSHEDFSYVHAFSFDKQILENMIINDIPQEEKLCYSIKPIKLYKPIFTTKINDDKDYNRDYLKIFLTEINDTIYDKNIFPIYGFNKIKNNKCEQVLLSLATCEDVILYKDLGISNNPIEIDTLYEESILNS